jgi:hypothetical protein
MKRTCEILLGFVAALLVLRPAAIGQTAVAGELKPVAFTRSDHAIQATTKSGDTLLAAREMLVDVIYPSGKTAKGDLFVLFDQATGLSYWQYWVVRPDSVKLRIAADFSNESRVYLAGDRLVVFLGRDQSVYIHESSRHADSLEDAESKASQEVTDRLGEIERDALGKDERQVTLPLPREFFAPKYSAAPGRAKLTRVSRQGSSWELTVQGQWTAKVTLNEKYEVTATERVP